MSESVEVNIFLDTTMTYKDPFFKNNYNRNLLKLAEVHGFPLYMSSVVFEETRNKYHENVKSRMQALETAVDDLSNFYPTDFDTSTIQCTQEDFMEKFDAFYKDLIERDVLQVLNYDHDILPELVERSIKRVKPFGPKKQEFRDAITWLTYANFVEEHQLDHCFFLTENVNDFCEGKGKIHQELRKDTERIKHYTSAKELLEKESILDPMIRTFELVEWVESENIDEEYISHILNQRPSFQEIYDYIQHYALNVSVDRFVSDAYDNGYCELSSMDVTEVEDSNVEVIGDEIIVSGTAHVSALMEVYFYNHFRESRIDDDYTHVGGNNVDLAITFSFSYNTKKEVDHLQLDDMEVESRIRLGIFDEDDY